MNVVNAVAVRMLKGISCALNIGRIPRRKKTCVQVAAWSAIAQTDLAALPLFQTGNVSREVKAEPVPVIACPNNDVKSEGRLESRLSTVMIPR